MSSSVGMEEIPPSTENEITDLIPETTVSLVNKMGKSTKAGNKAPQQAIDLWKENGFSR
jgi:tRNA (adenine-N(1)-)-methyltransferase non-catalytic subunit